MKKIFLLIIVLGLASGCAHKKENPWKDYDGMTAAAIFNQGEKHLAKKKYTRASKDFAAIDALYPFGSYAQRAQMEIIYAFYKDDEYASGLAAADRYLRLYPQDKYIDYVYYMKGLMSFEQDFNWYQSLFRMDPAPLDLSGKRESFISFNQIARLYPNSIYAQDSVLHMTFIRNMIARKEMSIADFYMERKAYLAAANRAALVVQHYNGTTSVPHALEVMALAYKGAGLPDLAENSYKILQASYPDSREFKRLSVKYRKK